MIEGEKVATWMTGKYADEYRCVDGAWLFSRVTLVFETISDVKDSWIDNPFISLNNATKGNQNHAETPERRGSARYLRRVALHHRTFRAR